MSRYIKKFRQSFSLGPTEERGVPMWVGYDIDGISGDLAHLGLTSVDEWDSEKLQALGVTSFTHVGPEDHELRKKLGL